MNASVSPPAPPARGRRVLLVWGVSLSAVLLLALGLIVWRYRLRPDPGYIEYPMLRASDIPTAVAAASDGTVWFTIEWSDALGLWRHGKIERLAKGTPNLEPIGLAVATDGSAWYTDATARAIAHISQSGDISTFPLSTPIAKLGRLAVAPDGAVWFAESTVYSITRLKDGAFTRYTVEPVRGGPYGVAVGADGTVWATVQSANTLVRITPDGTMAALDVPTHASVPTDIAVAPDGTVWFLEFRANKIGRYAHGQCTEFPVPGDEKAGLTGLAVAPDGAVWFGMLRAHSLGRLQHGVVKTLRLPRADARPYSVAVDATGNVWYADISGWLGMLPADRARSH
jgi:virginiamycin B lyase